MPLDSDPEHDANHNPAPTPTTPQRAARRNSVPPLRRDDAENATQRSLVLGLVANSAGFDEAGEQNAEAGLERFALRFQPFLGFHLAVAPDSILNRSGRTRSKSPIGAREPAHAVYQQVNCCQEER